MTEEAKDPPPRLWALLGAHAGDNNQVIALAEALQLPFETKQLDYNFFRHLGPRILGSSLLSLTARSRQSIDAVPLPDITISSGHRSVAVTRALRRIAGGRMRSIHVGFPRVSPRHFDLVIATPQYPIADQPHVLRVTYALTRAATTEPDRGDTAQLAELPHPRALLIVGGPSLYWEVDRERTLATLAAMIEEARRASGSVLVTTSPRTSRKLRGDIRQALHAADLPTVLAQPGGRPHYASLLGAADSIRVTADSVAMISDAIWTGKPVGIVPVRKSLLGSLVMGIMDTVRPGRPVYPQDLRLFWSALEEVGVSQCVAIPQVSTNDELRTILEHVMPIVAKA